MRVLFGGLMGLCLLASMPVEAHARGDNRAAAQNRSASSRAMPTPPRSLAPRSTARPSMTVGSARQPVTSGRYVRSLPSGRQGRLQAREPAYAFRGSLGRNAAPQGRGRSFAVVPYGRAMAQAPTPYRQSAVASCTMRGGRRLCTAGATRSVAFRWGSDLGAQTMSQSSCPDGTIATMAIGHTDVVRCVPL